MLNIAQSLVSKTKNKLKLLDLNKCNDLKINIGCGNVKFPGWVNTDLPESSKNFSAVPDVYLDIREKMPIKSGHVQFLYCEHVIEHLSPEQADFFLQEAYRVLKRGGVLRIATPDLEYIIKKYSSRSWQDQDWLSWPEYKFIQTPAQMLNIALRWWGHQYVYDKNELLRKLKEAGFKDCQSKDFQKSTYRELKNLETRKDSRLIVEAVK